MPQQIDFDPRRRLLQGARRPPVGQRRGDQARLPQARQGRTIRIPPAATRPRSRGSRTSPTRTTSWATPRSGPCTTRSAPAGGCAGSPATSRTARRAAGRACSTSAICSASSSAATPARGGRVHVEHIDFEDTRPRGGRRRRRDAQDAEFEQTVKASDGSWLRVDGNDVASDIRIAFDRAILGTIATVATIDGKAEVEDPAGHVERQEAAAARQGHARPRRRPRRPLRDGTDRCSTRAR